ncbi:hypothetical protein RHS01_08280 [Rhizoctonia solani]|uniref:SNF2 N-terminal domain-containing protein n=1 Tax=Rhizoctonia solani TaxID=456999 RepID=A0A8H7M201_9AGAM|nr:hypothetical protein RHS01_08280 [Rhizoctonia solani]
MARSCRWCHLVPPVLFDDMKKYANKWVASRQNQLLEKRLKKGKGKAKKTDKDESDPKLDTHGIPINKQQTEWKKNASISDFDNWHWLISRAFGGTGSLYKQLRALMKEFHCNVKTAHKFEHKQKKQSCQQSGKPFLESNVHTKTAFDTYWLHASQNIGLAVFGPAIISLGVPDKQRLRVVKAWCFRLFQNNVRVLGQTVSKSREIETELHAAYINAQTNFMAKAFHTINWLLQKVLQVQRVCGVDIEEEEGSLSWKIKIDALMQERSRVIQNGEVTRVKALVGVVVPKELMDQLMEEYSKLLRARQILVPANEPTKAQPLGEDDEPDLWSAGYGLFNLIGVTGANIFGRNQNLDLSGMWHQWVAVVKMVKRSFTNKIGKKGNPTLLANQVGLGKTVITVLYIQVIWHLQALHEELDWHKKWPKVLAHYALTVTAYPVRCSPVPQSNRCPARHGHGAHGTLRLLTLRYYLLLLGRRTWYAVGDLYYYMGEESIPDKPIILVVPWTLVSQWSATLSQWLEYGSYNCLEFVGGELDRKAFFASKAYKQAVSPRCSHLIIIAHNLQLALTATPVFTHPQNLLQIARILRVESFLGKAGQRLTQSINSKVALELRGWKADPEHNKLQAFLCSMRKGKVGTQDKPEALQSHVEDFILTRKGAIQSFRVFWTSRSVMKRLLEELDGVLIRRDEQSKSFDGKLLLDLLPKHTVILWLKLGDKMRKLLAKQTSTDKRISEGRADLHGFFTCVKQLLVHPGLKTYLDEMAWRQEEKRAKKEGRDTGLVHSADSKQVESNINRFVQLLFPTLDAYIANPSKKLNQMLEIVTHHIGNKNKNNPPLAWSPDGKQVPSHVSVSPDKAALPRQKIVIYCHLSASWAVATRMLVKKQEEAVAQFQSEDGPDIMLLSNVGTQGLNLQRGSVCIFVVCLTNYKTLFIADLLNYTTN